MSTTLKTFNRPWGRMEIWAQTPMYEARTQHLIAGRGMPQISHQKRDKTLMVVSGSLIVETWDCWDDVGIAQSRVTVLGVDTNFHIPAGTVHILRAPVGSDVIFHEVGTPECNDISYGQVQIDTGHLGYF